jgi:hypothetical protein
MTCLFCNLPKDRIKKENNFFVVIVKKLNGQKIDLVKYISYRLLSNIAHNMGFNSNWIYKR